jgi:protoheme IX farnesyltransferase
MSAYQGASANPQAAQATSTRRQLPAWLEVLKPRLIPLLLATTVGGMAVAEPWPLAPVRFLATLVGGALAAAAAGVLNCLWEQDLDAKMVRTSRRALPSGRLTQYQALALAISLTTTSVLVLTLLVNPLAAALSLIGLCSYVLLYTAWLKPRTSQNIVIGGLAGAIPPLVGAVAASSHPGWGGLWLFSLVMLWTPAHFWSLALLLREDYRSVGIPMLPVVKGAKVTARWISIYGLLTIFMSFFGILALPTGGWFYGVLILPFNARLLQLIDRLRLQPEDPLPARSLFRWSILYLFGVCLLLVLSRTPLVTASVNPLELLQIFSSSSGLPLA